MFLVFKAYTVVDPGTVVVHIKYAPIADHAVMSSQSFVYIAN
jgi:hypothetical protein